MQKGFVQPLAVIAVLVLIGLTISYFYFKKADTSVKLNNSFSSKNFVPSAEPESVYKNEKLGFEIKTPKGLVVLEDSEEGYFKRNNGNARKDFSGYVGYQPSEFLGGVYLVNEGESAEKAVFLVWVFKNTDNLDGKGWYSKYWYYPFLWGVFSYPDKGHAAPDEEATISGRLVNYALVGYQQNKPKYVLIPDKEKMYLLISYTGLDEKIGEQVLSSFKFLQ